MFRSFCITIRPRHGIKDDLVKKITSWLKKQDYAVGVLEKYDEERHLHAQIWNDKEKYKNDISKQMKRFCEAFVEDWDHDQKMVLREGIKVGYSDWYLDYLLDNDDKEYNDRVLINSPPDKTEPFYPSLEEQERVKNLANSVDPRFTKLEQQYYDWLGPEEETDLKSVARFLNWAMFEERIIKVIIQPRDRYAFCEALYLYISKSKDVYNFIPKTKEEKKLDKNFQILFDSIKEQNIVL